MTTAIQRTSLGELGYTPLSATSLGELGATIVIIPKGGIEDAYGIKRRKGRNQDEEDLQLIVMMVTVIEQERLK